MKLSQLFQIAVEAAIAADPRSLKDIKAELKEAEKKQKELKGKKKELADPERTWNPYSDSRILNGTGKEEMKNLIVGIDMETPEILLANELRKKGTKIDGILVHHPEGRALADLEKSMPVQIDVYKCYGVPENKSEGALRPRMEKIWRSIHSDNLLRVQQAAALMDFPMFGCHTVTDNLVWKYMEDTICKKSFRNLEELVDALLEIPEYEYYAKKGNPPIIVNGSPTSRTGKIVASEFTGGTNGPEELMKMQADAGVGTILSMHVTDKTLEVAKEHHVNIIQCSHMASDTIGMNILIDLWQKKGAKLKILECSGFVRFKRSKKK